MNCNGILCQCAAVLAIAAVADISSAQPRTVWTNEYDGPASQLDVGFNVELDLEENIVVVGPSVGVGTERDVVVIKYDRTGNHLWTSRYNGPDNLDDTVGDLVFDADNNIITSGIAATANEGTNFLLVKFDPDGNLLWANEYNGPGNGEDWTSLFGALAVDGDGNIYLTGYSWGANNHYEFTTIKYTPDGDEAWVEHYVGPYVANPNSLAWSLELAPSGHLYVAGNSRNLNGNVDYTVVKYDLDGNLVWDSQFDSVHGLGDGVYQTALDSNENLYVTGISDNPSGGFDYCVAKFDSNGVVQWEGRYNGGVIGYHYGWIIEADDAGNAYVSGAWNTSGGEHDIVTVKFDTNGAVAWATRHRTQYFGEDWAYDIELDPDGNVIITGYEWNWYDEGQNLIVIKYDPAGNVLWEESFNGAANGNDAGFGVAIDDAGDIFVTGPALGTGTGSDIVTIKYSDNPPPNLVVSPLPLLAGANGTFTVENFEPDTASFLVYSTSGLKDTFVDFLNVTLALRNPQQAGTQKKTDVNGTVQWKLPIPKNASGAHIWLQAMQYNQVTNVVETDIQ